MKQKQFWILVCVLVLTAMAGSARAGLLVKVDEPKTTGNKAYVKLTMKNTFTNAVDSARAAVFLLDGQGKVVGQATRWVLGKAAQSPDPNSHPSQPTTLKASSSLAPDSERPFFFVVPLAKPVQGPLHSRLLFDRLILSSGPLADANKEVILQPSGK